MKNSIIKFGYIYIILNKINGKFYIGSTKDLHKRKLRHFRELKNNTHHCIHLQRSVNKHGLENFEYICIETSFNYIKREQQILDFLDFNDLYNVSKTATGGDMISNHPNREQLIKNATQRLQNVKRLPRFKENNSNWKGGKTFCKCGNRINSNTIECNKCKDRTGINNPFYNKTHSKESKDKMRVSSLGKFNGIQSKIVIIENMEYSSLSEASRQLGIHVTTICFRINSPNKKFINYNYK
jgi:group I intron endonuclease